MFGASHGGPFIVVDVDGFRNGQDTIGKDVFAIRVFDNKFLPLGAEGTYVKEQNDGECLCDKNAGLDNATYIAGAAGVGEVVSGGCCSYTKLYDK